ncbi:MAG: hypothetical protein JWO69_461 [Thermoleophilia bacterium]|nr:hypothetical protein [Thermoleophilia bacterium]
MDDSRRSGTSFADDLNEFDNLLDDEVTPPARSGRTGRMPVARPAADGDEGDAGTRRSRLRISPDWNRIAAALFVGAIVLLVLWFAVSSILDARRNGAYEEYFGEVRDLATQSASQGAELDQILTDPNFGDRSQRIAGIEQLSKRAAKLSQTATELETPDQLVGAHDWLQTSLAYRAHGIDGVQRALTASIDSKDADASAKQVASAMSRLVASDVVWADSFDTAAKDVLDADEVQDVQVPGSVTVKDFDSVSITGIKQMMTRLKTSGTKAEGVKTVAAPKDGKIRGGALEGGRVTVAPSGQTLTLNGLTEIKGGDNVEFEVPFTNQGEVQLTDVPVELVLRGDDSDPITLSGVIERVDPGQTETVKVPLGQIPDFASLLEMDISVGPIAGEKTTDNNRASYQVQFVLPD